MKVGKVDENGVDDFAGEIAIGESVKLGLSKSNAHLNAMLEGHGTPVYMMIWARRVG